MSDSTGDEVEVVSILDLEHEEAVDILKEVHGMGDFDAHAWLAAARGEPICLHAIEDEDDPQE